MNSGQENRLAEDETRMVISESDSQEEHSEENQDLDDNNETPVLTGHTTPGVVSSIVSSEALQADLLQAGELQALQHRGEVSHREDAEDLSAHEDDYEDREDYHNGREDPADEHEVNEEVIEGNRTNQVFDSYWTKPSGNEPITVSSQDSSQEESVYQLPQGEDDSEDNHEDELEVISDSDSEEDHEEYLIDRFIPIQNDDHGDNYEDHPGHPSLEIAEPEGLHIDPEGEYEDEYEDEEDNEDENEDGYIHEDEEDPSMWRRETERRPAPPPRRISSSSDEVICLDSD